MICTLFESLYIKILFDYYSRGKRQRHNVIYDVISCGQFSKMAPTKDHCKKKKNLKIYFETKSPITVIRTMQKIYADVCKCYEK